MPPGSTSGELSLRHLPDVSDSSFSFQIPGAAQDYNLIAEDDLDFFGGANVSGGATTLSPPANIAPLTLRDLTPRPAFEKRLFKDSKRAPFLSEEVFDKHNPKEGETRTTRLQRPDLSKVRTKVMSNLRPITSSFARPPPADATLAPGRMTTLKKDIDTLTVDLHIPSSPNDQEPMVMDNQRPKGIRKTSLEKKLPPLASRSERRQKLVPRNKQIVIEGGVTKSRSTNNLSAGQSPARISNLVEELRPIFPSHIKPTVSEDLNGDESVSDISSVQPSGGVAERLAQYGKNLTNSFRVHNSMLSLATNDLSDFVGESHVAPKITSNDVPLTISSIDNGGPLTLSQVSPRKRPSYVPNPPTPPAKDLISPLRTSSKRPASTSEFLSCKKGKTDPAPSRNIGSGSSNLASATLRQAIIRKRHVSNASASSFCSKPVGEEISKPKTTGTITGKASTLRRSKPSHDEGKTMTKFSSASASTSSRSARVLRNSRPQDDEAKRPVSSLSSSKGKGKVSVNKISERPIFQIPPLPDATKSAPFQSFTESRLLARNGGPSKGHAEASSQSQSRCSQKERKYHVPIPDFQAMHAAQEAKLALLKENIHPTVPHPIQLVTDLRVKERQKFDEMMKEKEREQERLNEERRKEREEQEERELRELRKKTIPKAHCVPEWYKEAPRKQDSKFDSLGR